MRGSHSQEPELLTTIHRNYKSDVDAGRKNCKTKQRLLVVVSPRADTGGDQKDKDTAQYRRQSEGQTPRDVSSCMDRDSDSNRDDDQLSF